MAKPRKDPPPPATDDAPAPALKPKELAEQLADPAFRERIEQAISALPPEKAAELVALLEASIRRRKIELFGYIASAVVLLLGMVIAVYTYGRGGSRPVHRVVFLAPLAAAGVIMIAVARWAAKREAAERQQRSAPKD
jgi:peptidoglycan/LPS O-acetylase OafA/YrhL